MPRLPAFVCCALLVMTTSAAATAREHGAIFAIGDWLWEVGGVTIDLGEHIFDLRWQTGIALLLSGSTNGFNATTWHAYPTAVMGKLQPVNWGEGRGFLEIGATCFYACAGTFASDFDDFRLTGASSPAVGGSLTVDGEGKFLVGGVSASGAEIPAAVHGTFTIEEIDYAGEFPWPITG